MALRDIDARARMADLDTAAGRAALGPWGGPLALRTLAEYRLRAGDTGDPDAAAEFLEWDGPRASVALRARGEGFLVSFDRDPYDPDLIVLGDNGGAWAEGSRTPA